MGNGIGSWGIYKWQDMAWTELKHRVRFYYWNGSQWVQYQKPLGTLYELETWLYSGAHLYTQPRTIEWQVNIIEYPNVPTGSSQNRACTWSWFQASNTFGNDKCSNAVTLTKPPP